MAGQYVLQLIFWGFFEVIDIAKFSRYAFMDKALKLCSDIDYGQWEKPIQVAKLRM